MMFIIHKLSTTLLANVAQLICLVSVFFYQSDYKEEEILQLKKIIEQLEKEKEERQRESSMKDDKIKELEQGTFKET